MTDQNPMLEQRVAKVEDAWTERGSLCPWRDDIKTAKNNERRICKNEDSIEELENVVVGVRLDVAKLMALSGGVGGLVGALVSILATTISKAMGGP